MKTVEIFTENSSLISLNEDNLFNTYGGAPSPETSFGYDLAYYTVRVLCALAEGASHIKG